MQITHPCTKCFVEYPYEKFQLRNGKPSGQCRACKTAAMKAKRKKDGIPVKKYSQIIGTTKLCMCCKLFKEFTQFSPSIRGLAGISAYCKPCKADKYRDKGRAVKNTTKYRQVNRETYLANHRINMFERKSKIKITDDGTVTKEFLKNLYSTTACYYCNSLVPLKQRTADHKIALNKGGLHSASNLVMACFKCNSSKRDLSEHEFKERLKNAS